MIELKNITKKFGEKIAVDDISIKINKGEVVGFLGPNGAGKTTTMRIITGFFIPDEGEVEIQGQKMSNDPVKYKSKIGYMPENNPLYKEMIVKDSLEFVLDIHDVSKEERENRIREAVRATGIQEVFYKPISDLSKGYKQRVGIAQVLVQDPEVLILDEPTEGLDPNQRVEIRELIKKLGKERTVIVSTHVMQEVEVMCNRIVIINNGKIISDGTKDSILKGVKEGTTLNLKVKSEGEKITKKDFEDLKPERIQINPEGNKTYSIEIFTNEKNAFEKLSKKIRSKDWTVYELNQKKENLEEVFQELTQRK